MSSSLHQSAGEGLPAECDPPRSRGASLARSLERELIPRLLAHARGLPMSHNRTSPAHEAIAGPDVDAFVTACLSRDEERCPAIVAGYMAAGAPLQQICLELLSPAASKLGVMWEEDEVDFLDVTLGLGRMQRVVRDLGRRVAADSPMSEDAGQAFLCGMPEEQHSLGLAMVAEFFVADGWGVTVGPPLGVDDIMEEIATRWYDVVGLSAGVVERMPRITDIIRRIRSTSMNTDLAIMVGGRAFIDMPELVSRVGADASAPDAAQGPMVARTLVQARRAAVQYSARPLSAPSQ